MSAGKNKREDSTSKTHIFSINSHKTKKKSVSKPNTRTRSKSRKAASKIKKFFKRTEMPRKIAFLKAVCSDSGECVTFGKETKNIKRVFNDFKLDRADSHKLRRIGLVSMQGFIVEVEFTRSGYTAHGVLKSSKTARSDNLFYEAFVGIFINKLTAFFPCFVETYASYFYEDKTLYEKLKEGGSVNKRELVKGLTENKPLDYNMIFEKSFLKKSCDESQFFCASNTTH